MFKLFKKHALIALTFIVCASSGFGLNAKKPKRFYSTHSVSGAVVYKQTNLRHCHSGCKRAPYVFKNCTSRCRACLSEGGEGVEFAWSGAGTVNTMEEQKSVCRVGALAAWKWHY